jgi:hypothetical protein
MQPHEADRSSLGHVNRGSDFDANGDPSAPHTDQARMTYQ